MSYKKQIILLLVTVTLAAKAQDTVHTAKKSPERRHELGISIIVPAIIALGTTDYNERYTNLSYRYFLSERHAIKPFVGVSTINNLPDNSDVVIATSTSTVYSMQMSTTPSNFQVGVGYEFIMGKKKLKHVIGADLLYNNKFLREESFYYEQTADYKTTRLDTGTYVKTKNYDKIGLNLSYTLRYDMSKRWMISASTVMTHRFYWEQKRSSNYEANFVGLISDISIFYKF